MSNFEDLIKESMDLELSNNTLENKLKESMRDANKAIIKIKDHLNDLPNYKNFSDFQEKVQRVANAARNLKDPLFRSGYHGKVGQYEDLEVIFIPHTDNLTRNDFTTPGLYVEDRKVPGLSTSKIFNYDPKTGALSLSKDIKTLEDNQIIELGELVNVIINKDLILINLLEDIKDAQNERRQDINKKQSECEHIINTEKKLAKTMIFEMTKPSSFTAKDFFDEYTDEEEKDNEYDER